MCVFNWLMISQCTLCKLKGVSPNRVNLESDLIKHQAINAIPHPYGLSGIDALCPNGLLGSHTAFRHREILIF